MPSSKGKPTDPALREKVKEEVKGETNKDGGGKGQWSAWKAVKLSKEYEQQGGGYEDEAGSKNEPTKGAPRAKAAGKKKAKQEKEGEEDAGDGLEEKPKANTAKKAKPVKGGKEGKEGKKEKRSKEEGKKGPGRPKKGATNSKEPVEGTRKSARVAEKRKSTGEVGGGETKKARK